MGFFINIVIEYFFQTRKWNKCLELIQQSLSYTLIKALDCIVVIMKRKTLHALSYLSLCKEKHNLRFYVVKFWYWKN